MRGSAPVERQRAARHRGAHTHPLQKQEPASGADPRISPQTLVLPSAFPPPQPTRPPALLQFKLAFSTRQSTVTFAGEHGQVGQEGQEAETRQQRLERLLGQVSRADGPRASASRPGIYLYMPAYACALQYAGRKRQLVQGVSRASQRGSGGGGGGRDLAADGMVRWQ